MDDLFLATPSAEENSAARSVDELFEEPATQPAAPPAASPDAASVDDLFAPDPEPAVAAEGMPVREAPEAVSADELFAPDAEPAVAAEAVPEIAAPAEVRSVDDLFAPGPAEAVGVPPAGAPIAEAPGVEPEAAAAVAATRPATPPASGFVQSTLAYTFADPEHWSLFKTTVELGTSGRLDNGMRWKVSGRAAYDPIYDLTNHYNRQVRDDQRLEARVWETYLDIPAGNWDFRIGRQHIVWGEMVALFFADVVSARDLREFILPDFDMIRIPQWAARMEYFGSDWHAEAIWIPIKTYDEIGKPYDGIREPGRSGAEFFPFRPPSIAGFDNVIRTDKPPSDSLDNSAYGLRLSYLVSGWDWSAFYYSGLDHSPAFARSITPPPGPGFNGTIDYRPVYERVHQVGGTMAKDLGWTALKAEVVYTWDRLFETTDLTSATGLVKQDFLDVIAGLEFSFTNETRLNLQLFQRRFSNHDRGIIPDDTETGMTVLLATKAFHPKVEPEILYLGSLNRDDWNLQAKLTWEMQRNWRLVGGLDLFGGARDGLFGRFDNTDRVFTEVRYSF